MFEVISRVIFKLANLGPICVQIRMLCCTFLRIHYMKQYWYLRRWFFSSSVQILRLSFDISSPYEGWERTKRKRKEMILLRNTWRNALIVHFWLFLRTFFKEPVTSGRASDVLIFDQYFQLRFQTNESFWTIGEENSCWSKKIP